MRFSATATAERLLPEQLALRAKPALRVIDSVLFPADERSDAGRVSIIAFIIRVCSAAIAFLSQVLIARWIGGFEYGIFVLVWTTMIIVGNLCCLGFHSSVIRFIPEYREKGMMDELRGVLLASRVLVLVASTIVTIIGAASIWLLSPIIESYYVLPFLLGIICLPMIALSDVLQGLARANSLALLALSPTYIIRPFLILAFMAAAFFTGFEPDAQTAVIATILATYATTLIQLAGVSAKLDRKVAKGPRKIFTKRWLAISLPIFLVEGFFFLLTNADVLLVGFYMTPQDVGIYFATVKTLALVHFVYFAVKAGVAQRYAQFAHGETEKLASFARETVSWTFWPSLFMALVVLALGKPMLMLFGPGFDAGYPLLFLLVVAVVLRAAVGPCESLLTMTGNQNICALVYGLTLAINIAVSMVLIPVLGLWGAAIGTAVAVLFEAVALAFTVWRKLGIAMVLFVPPIQREGLR
ncbi:lipopolysaccharide biosynthesis protein [Mesorhizobium sp. SB112]|uniref:lipopolysaccharide biosynthesis protein n=1 Tax=Mesorhizobium sp. SB112 TaxID=3151853 RepID=UPI003263780C